MIPIRNIYYMLAYAWNHVQESRTVDLSGVNAETPEDLLALVLARGTLRLLKRGVDRDYLVREQEIRGVRGRVLIDATIKRVLRTRSQVACRFDELSDDIPANRIIASTFGCLRRIPTLERQVRRELDLVASRFPRVTPLRLNPADFSGVVIHRNNRFYRFLLDVCRLIYENLIADQSASGALRFRDFRRDEAYMGSLFQDFVRNFLSLEQRGFRVAAPKVPWDVTDSDEYSLSMLPDMQTDIVLESNDVVRIVDTKFYREPLSDYMGSKKLRSAHLYQIMSYVRNWAARERESGRRVEGILLYAAVGEELAYSFSVHGQRLSARTVDVSLSPPEVRRQLLEVAARRDLGRR